MAYQHVLDDREPEAGPARGASAIAPVETLEETGKLLFSPLPKVVLKASLKTLNLVHT